MKNIANLVLGRVAAVICWMSAMIGPAPSLADDAKRPAPPTGLRIYFAEHSLMWYVPKSLGEMADDAKIKDHKLVGVYDIGGSTTLRHWNLPDAENQPKKVLKTREVDVFVMSPFPFPDEGVDNFVKLGLEHNPKMRFIVQLSWGGGDNDNQSYPNGVFDKLDKEQTEALEKSPEQLRVLNEKNIEAGEAQADAINKRYGNGQKILALVPSAQAMVKLRIKIANNEWPGLTKQGELFTDQIHASPPMEALNTYLHFAVLYRRSPVGLPMPTTLKDAKREAWDEKFNRSLQELAWETVTEYAYSLVKPENAK